jgi:hypothetical protein
VAKHDQCRSIRAARALLNIDQRLGGPVRSFAPTIQRMEASDGVIRQCGLAEKLVAALDAAGIELIGEGASSQGGGRGVRLKVPSASAKPVPQRSRKVPARRAG